MNTYQTLIAMVVLVFVLSVIVQALQEIVKSLLQTKADTMSTTIQDLMGGPAVLQQIRGVLNTRGLEITDLEHFSKHDFRQLLEETSLLAPRAAGQTAALDSAFEDLKNRVVSVYDAARASFRRRYTRKNKMSATLLSCFVVLTLNASLIRVYEVLAANQAMSQAIAGTAPALVGGNNSSHTNGSSAQSADPSEIYSRNRQAIMADLQKYPILVRTRNYPQDFRQEPFDEIFGLLLMVGLVSLGAPFWNDVLKGTTGLNHILSNNKSLT